MEPILHCCCGVDVHKDMIEACIISGIDNPAIIRQQFGTYPNDLMAFAKWLEENDCFNVAMESTGVYWRPIYEAIEEHLVYRESIVVANARMMKNLPGRKSDVKDAEWIATLMQHGLLKASFVPERDIRNLRELARIYKKTVSEMVRCKNQIEKLLQLHGFKLSSVLSDITNVSGIHILTVLSQTGSLSVDDVEKAISSNTKHTAREIQIAISGSLTELERFILTDYLDELRFIQTHTQVLLAKMQEVAAPHARTIEILDSIVGIDITAALLIIAEISANPQAYFKTSTNLCSWAGLSPRNDESAGKVKSRKILHGNPYLKSILCQCAWVAVRSRNNPFGNWFWSHQGKLGKKKAIIAVSRKMLSLIYLLISKDELYDKDYAALHSKK